jgi:hypothetical protein
MRKLGLLQISKQLIVANDNTSGVPDPDVPAPPIAAPERAPAPARTRDAPDPVRGGARGRMSPAARGHAANLPPHRALRPRRRS